MAKSISADKRENEKKRLARRAEKQKKKEEKKPVSYTHLTLPTTSRV